MPNMGDVHINKIFTHQAGMAKSMKSPNCQWVFKVGTPSQISGWLLGFLCQKKKMQLSLSLHFLLSTPRSEVHEGALAFCSKEMTWFFRGFTKKYALPGILGVCFPLNSEKILQIEPHEFFTAPLQEREE